MTCRLPAYEAALQLRTRQLCKLADTTYDVLIIGGGINGAVAAAALAGKGVKTALIEQRDFAGYTSQQSSNLVWGGIKYMETCEFGLVRQLCRSRNRLRQHYPASVQEIRFLTTSRRGLRHHPLPLWLGAWVYWLLGNGFTRRPRLLSVRRIRREEPVINTHRSSGGLEYSDAYLYDNDARFVFGFVRAAMDHGCVAANYVESLRLQRAGGLWYTQARDVVSGTDLSISARVLINATGPFVDAMNRLSGVQTEHHHVFSKGIHLIVERVTPHDRVLAFFAADGRLFFAIPMGAKTCIGTTDTRVETPITQITEADRRFVLDNINACLRLQRPLTTADIIAERCGVRPLAVKGSGRAHKDFLQLSRRHAIDVDCAKAHISIFGGKLTDCLNVGEEICARVAELGMAMPHPQCQWYGEPDASVRQDFLRRAQAIRLDDYTPVGADEPLSTRLWRRYGAEAFALLDAIDTDPRQAEVMIAGTAFVRCEIDLVARREMIVTLEDFLRRRSHLAMLMRHAELQGAAGLQDVCAVFFGPQQATQKYHDYFRPHADVTHRPAAPADVAPHWGSTGE